MAIQGFYPRELLTYIEQKLKSFCKGNSSINEVEKARPSVKQIMAPPRERLPRLSGTVVTSESRNPMQRISTQKTYKNISSNQKENNNSSVNCHENYTNASFNIFRGEMPSKPAGFNRVLDGLKKKQLQHDFKLERAAEFYTPVQNIGSGAFGIVCEATSSDGVNVAIKKVAHASATPTLARRTLREIRVLRYIDHPNIVRLCDIFRTKGPLGIDVFLVMDLMANNLHQVIYGSEKPLDESDVKRFLIQLLNGLEYIHSVEIAHRDLKPSNLLISNDFTLRIADFGMAKYVGKEPKSNLAEEHCFYMTQHVATLPYRAPELLFVMPEHSTAVDMWAVGCIFGEMVMRNETFPGRSVQGQIKILLSVLGKPTQDVINKIRCDRTKKLIEDFACPMDIAWDEFFYCNQRGDEQIISKNCQAIDFVKSLLEIDVSKRLTVKEAIHHPYIGRYSSLQSSCPFRVKLDMTKVESLTHDELIQTLRMDVRSAESDIYKEIPSGDSTGDQSSESTETSSGENVMRQEKIGEIDNVQDIATQISTCELEQLSN